jgi:glycerophosphoryl diester phosphodiesterase
MQEKKTDPSYVDLKRPTIFAHRGSSAYAPENTLTAFKLAIDQHADAIELDAKLTADGQVVVIHDDTVDRTTNGTGQVNFLTLAQLQRLDAGSKFPPKNTSEKIPSLEEVFETFGQKIFINVELKNYSTPTDELPEKVAALVKKYKLEDRVLLSSFNLIALIRARKLLSKIPLGFITISGLADVTMRTKLVRFGPLLALHPNYEDISPYLIRTAHQAKCRIYPYTVNHPKTIEKLINAGVDGIFTDDPCMAEKAIVDLIKSKS